MKAPLLLLSSALVIAATATPLTAQTPTPPTDGPQAVTSTSGEAAAVAAADAWLALVDDGKYTATWDSAAGIFKKAVPKERWENLLKSRRQPLGKLLSRKNTSRQPTSTIPNAPDGQYVVLHFDSSYEKKKTAVESVTCVLDADGSWRVTGYLVR